MSPCILYDWILSEFHFDARYIRIECNICIVNAKCGCFNQRFPFALTTSEREEGEKKHEHTRTRSTTTTTTNEYDESLSNKANLSRLSTLYGWLHTAAQKRTQQIFPHFLFSHTHKTTAGRKRWILWRFISCLKWIRIDLTFDGLTIHLHKLMLNNMNCWAHIARNQLEKIDEFLIYFFL